MSEVKHFIEQIIENDLAANTYNGAVVTRFPPEPNGYLHIGHAKAICLNFAMANKYDGYCNLRFDDTNPVKEELEFAQAIEEDVSWLGFKWRNKYYASDYFEKLYHIALEFIKKDLAYVCSLSAEQTREYRGTLTTPGIDSPYRKRSIEENLDLFERMRNGEFPEGAHVLRAKIDMSSGNINMRDPVMYRILHKAHPHVGNKWCIYPMYDYTHCFSDYFENITHSLCTLEYQDHRPLYEWFLNQIYNDQKPQQIEFAKLNITHTLLSKRNLKRMVDDKMVSGWDDPRMLTLRGLRRRGYTPEALVNFSNSIGISKSDSLIEMKILEECVRDDLNQKAMRVMAVINPLKVTLINLPKIQELEAALHPQIPELGTRKIVFGKTLYIERDDFQEQANKDFFRLVSGGEVRLRYAYVIKCEEVIKNHAGEIVELKCSIDPHTLGKNPEGRKVKGVIHWVDAQSAREVEIRLYERMFNHPAPNSADSWEDMLTMLNPNSIQITTGLVECNIPSFIPETRYQFERLGYFIVDRHDSSPEMPVFNRILPLRD